MDEILEEALVFLQSFKPFESLRNIVVDKEDEVKV